MNALIQISLVVLLSANCCYCAPGLIRVIGETDSPVVALRSNKDEVTFASNGVPPKSPLEQQEEAYISESANLDQEFRLGELLRNQISIRDVEQEKNLEDEPELIPIPLPNPIKSSVDINAHKNAISKMTGVDPYEKLLESFIRGIMSRVLQAEIKQVRVEEMGHSKRKKTVYL